MSSVRFLYQVRFLSGVRFLSYILYFTNMFFVTYMFLSNIFISMSTFCHAYFFYINDGFFGANIYVLSTTFITPTYIVKCMLFFSSAFVTRAYLSCLLFSQMKMANSMRPTVRTNCQLRLYFVFYKQGKILSKKSIPVSVADLGDGPCQILLENPEKHVNMLFLG